MFLTASKTVGFATTIGIALGMLLWSMPAHAYLDPATGSILLQGLLAGVAGVMMVARLYWRRIKAFFRGQRGGAALEETEPTASPEAK